MQEKFIFRLEKLGSILCMLYFAGCFRIMPPIEVSLEPLGGSLTELFNIIPYLVIPFLVAGRWKNFVYVCTRSLLLLLLLAYINFSVLWSGSPEITLSTSKWLLIMFLFASYLSSRFKLKDSMWLLTLVFGITAIESAIVCLLLPFYGVHPTGEWSGIYHHKSELGSQMSLSSCIFLHMALSNLRFSWILWSLFILSISLIILSQSTTSLLIAITFIPLLFIFKLMQNNKSKLQAVFTIIALSIIIFISLWLLNNLEFIVATQGKDLTFTGRTPMWLDLINKIADRPFIGYGYGGFWSSSEALNIKAEYKWAGDAHNGFITLWLELGLVGVVLFTFNLLQFFWKSLRKIIFYAKTWEDFFPMQFLVYISMMNLSESKLIIPSISFLVYIFIFLSLTLEQQQISKIRYSRKVMTTNLG